MSIAEDLEFAFISRICTYSSLYQKYLFCTLPDQHSHTQAFLFCVTSEEPHCQPIRSNNFKNFKHDFSKQYTSLPEHFKHNKTCCCCCFSTYLFPHKKTTRLNPF